jgi:hypothetical protein
VSATDSSLLCPFASGDDRVAELWRALPFLDLAVVLFERVRLEELRPPEDFFCVWAIPALLSRLGFLPVPSLYPRGCGENLLLGRAYSSLDSWRSAL